ncbi:uncharacterized protein LOC141629443 [Silene latifolia]|uniref:uncharacterized protein LOC141629443 n=1 Tax=Silene latifolia TaxID=37657 RepID=UPI003D78A94E
MHKDPSNLAVLEEESAAAVEYRTLSKAHCSFLSQKAKIGWLCEGDENTKYFHNQIKAKQMHNKILQIKDKNGQHHTNPLSIEKAFLDYYVELLGDNKDTSDVHVPTVRIGSLISDQHRSILLKPVSSQEVKDCIFSIPSTKSPGPDGFSSQFYRDSWDIIGKDITGAVLDFFATDDLLLFCKGNAVSIMWLLRGFFTFSATSWLALNNDKTDIYFNGVSKDIMVDIVKVFGFRIGTLPFKYLGVPISSKKLSKFEGHKLIERIVQRIRSLGARKLSYAGRLVLVKTVLSTLHSYWASMFLIPSGIMDKVDSICRNFLCGGRDSYLKTPNINWNTCCKPKDEGGLGLKNAKRVMNIFSINVNIVKDVCGDANVKLHIQFHGEHMVKWYSLSRSRSGLQRVVTGACFVGLIYGIWHVKNCARLQQQVQLPSMLVNQVWKEVKDRWLHRNKRPLRNYDQLWLDSIA